MQMLLSPSYPSPEVPTSSPLNTHPSHWQCCVHYLVPVQNSHTKFAFNWIQPTNEYNFHLESSQNTDLEIRSRSWNKYKCSQKKSSWIFFFFLNSSNKVLTFTKNASIIFDNVLKPQKRWRTLANECNYHTKLLYCFLLFTLFFLLLQLYCPSRISPMGNSGRFPRGKPAATESRYPTYCACWVL